MLSTMYVQYVLSRFVTEAARIDELQPTMYVLGCHAFANRRASQSDHILSEYSVLLYILSQVVFQG